MEEKNLPEYQRCCDVLEQMGVTREERRKMEADLKDDKLIRRLRQGIDLIRKERGTMDAVNKGGASK